MASDLINPSEYMAETTEVDQLKARIERLERFIVQGSFLYDGPAMLTESNLSDTIRHTVDHNMWIDISAQLKGGDY